MSTASQSESTGCTDYNFLKLEPFWQAYWEKNKTFKAEDFSEKPKYYVLDMLPYPSGAGLHIGHPEGYTASDILGRMKKAQGFNVLHPMGWDAFGLPAEQHAITTGTPPAVNTQANIDTFRRQIKSLGFGIDWDREINTTDPSFYKWTQWIFLHLFKMGLAYVDKRPVWWCPALGTALANEEVIEGRSERGNHPVERRNQRQWVLRITAYAQKLLEGLDTIDWPESTKRQQTAWIGHSVGAEISFDIQDNAEDKVKIFTTCPDTLFGCTYMVLAPEHPLLAKLTTEENYKAVQLYKEQAARKSDLNRTDLAKDKTGVFTGSYAINPANNKAIPIWVADYVLMSYGTGAIMAVPAHDERDFEFAQKFELPITPVIAQKDSEETPLPYTGPGKLINSDQYNGLGNKEAKQVITEALNKEGHGKETVNYKLRDWIFSRQRYWGEPFPVVWVSKEDYEKVAANKQSPFQEFLPEVPVTFSEEGGATRYALPLPTQALPVELPEVDSYQPSGTGESPLANSKTWLQVALDIETGDVHCREAQGNEISGVRETDTMPQWAGSCWYYLRYLDPSNTDAFIDPKIEAYWQTPDFYIGGAEHAVLHLLYARFWHKVLHDIGVLNTPEPFPKLFHQGIILGELEFTTFKDSSGNYVSANQVEQGPIHKETKVALSSEKIEADAVEKKGDYFVLKSDPNITVDARAYKMSKSRGNVVNPDDIVQNYGADALRLYEMFLGPLEAMKPWSTQGIGGMSRFLRKVWREVINPEGKINPKITQSEDSAETKKLLAKTIKKVTQDIETLNLNTAISQMMILLGHLQKQATINQTSIKQFLQLLAPFAPHITEELWARLGEKESITCADWPTFDEAIFVENTVKVVVQVNGKMRAELELPKDIAKEGALTQAAAHAKVVPFLEDKTRVKDVYVPGRIINFVVR